HRNRTGLVRDTLGEARDLLAGARRRVEAEDLEAVLLVFSDLVRAGVDIDRRSRVVETHGPWREGGAAGESPSDHRALLIGEPRDGAGRAGAGPPAQEQVACQARSRREPPCDAPMLRRQYGCFAAPLLEDLHGKPPAPVFTNLLLHISRKSTGTDAGVSGHLPRPIPRTRLPAPVAHGRVSFRRL